jgi:general secretion pathway protein F
MATFFYKAVAKGGNVVEGTLDGATDKAVAVRLHGMGMLPLEIASKRASQPWKFDLRFGLGGGVSAKEVMFFTQELSTLINAGLPLDRSLTICKQLSEKPRMRAMVEDILQGIKQGKTFADSLAVHPRTFSKLFVNMVKAGEASGSLPQVLERLVDFQQSADELKSYLISSLIYPALLTLVGGASIIILLNYVVPKFASIFDDAGRALPLPTQILLAVSNFTKTYWWVFVLGIVVLGIAFVSFTRTPKGRLIWDRTKLRIVLLGQVLRKIEVARISRTLGTLVHNAVPLVHSLNIVREISNNTVISKAISEIAEGVKKGEGVAKPMQKTGVFPPLAVHLIEVGEETGRLDTMLLELSKVYDKEVRAAIKNLIALFEPVMILVMGLVVGVIVVSMMLAIVSINDVPF